MFLITKNHWEVKKTRNKGLGVFAKKKIKAGTPIADYLGKVIRTADYDLAMDKEGLFLMYLTDEASIYPNLKKPGAHLLNHSCSPNCWIYTHQGHTLFFTLKDIRQGEELTISYLLSPKDKFCKNCPHNCNCESSNCTGTMHLSSKKYKLWQKFQENQKGTEIAKYTFGKDLQKLKTYPKTIPFDPIYAQISNTKPQSSF